MRAIVVVACVTVVTLSGCDKNSRRVVPPPTVTLPISPTPASTPSLRVSNVGSRDVGGLVVVFPDERIEFGDVAARSTTSYRQSSKGVFGYAAYQFRFEGRSYSQPVIDWVGAQPLSGDVFTYAIELVEGPPWGMNIRLVSTSREQ
jgi:hypothetical protein